MLKLVRDFTRGQHLITLYLEAGALRDPEQFTLWLLLTGETLVVVADTIWML